MREEDARESVCEGAMGGQVAQGSKGRDGAGAVELPGCGQQGKEEGPSGGQ